MKLEVGHKYKATYQNEYRVGGRRAVIRRAVIYVEFLGVYLVNGHWFVGTRDELVPESQLLSVEEVAADEQPYLNITVTGVTREELLG